MEGSSIDFSSLAISVIVIITPGYSCKTCVEKERETDRKRKNW